MEILEILLVAFGLCCFARVVLSLFSKRIANSVRRLPYLHSLGALIFIFYALSYAPSFLSLHWPPVSIKRKAVLATIQRSGGWSAFTTEAVRIIGLTRTNSKNIWRAYDQPRPIRLPKGFPILTALNPVLVEVRPQAPSSYEHQVVLARIRGGGPFYALQYDPAGDASAWSNSFRIANLKWEQLAPEVYEFYQN